MPNEVLHHVRNLLASIYRSRYRPGRYYEFSKLVEDLIDDKTINMAILGKCRGFVDDRNRSSHKPKTRRAAVEAYRKTKNCFLLGLELLEELPEKIEAKGYRFRFL